MNSRSSCHAVARCAALWAALLAAAGHAGAQTDWRRLPLPQGRYGAAFAVDPVTGLGVLHGGTGHHVYAPSAFTVTARVVGRARDEVKIRIRRVLELMG